MQCRVSGPLVQAAPTCPIVTCLRRAFDRLTDGERQVEYLHTNGFGSAVNRKPTHERMRHDSARRCKSSVRRVSRHVHHQARRGWRLRSLRQCPWSARPHRSACPAGAYHWRRRSREAISGGGCRMGWRDRRQRCDLRHGCRRGNDLSRLQTGAFHSVLDGRWRRCRDCRHRRHLFVLRPEGEDRHGSASRGRVQPRAGRGRTRRTCHDGRIRLADALARRRQPPDPWRQERGTRHLPHADGSRQRPASRIDDR